ncbi:BZ3500_MvSof-1268-A1-R1_Chr12-2g03916 [Microbotryum saponariae]|uniref:BZ3500_MvSof-1268-A1-R1_Chr12-2g03916 protein n=1 Tax=Microbotryum saponariae TaxID=289078 RepID=A0A2X0MRD0_9BASI|nr:BZ3500_MvSof-1268-A1-R1_Chr12-2g03916 [Microbotryum saponariae]
MSSTAQQINQIANEYNSKLNKVAPKAVGIQLALMAALGLTAIVSFSILRPNNSVVYQPKVKYSEDEKRPPKLGKGLTSWVGPTFRTDEQQLLTTIGLDAVTYLRFLKMCRNALLVTAALTCAVLIPLDVIYNLRNVTSKNRNSLLILTISKVRGSWLWAHVTMTYVLTAVVFYFIWVNYDQMVKMRWQWFRSDEYQNTLHARSIMVTQIQKRDRSDEGLFNLLRTLQIPYPTTAVHIGRKVGTLPELIQRHNDAVRALEGVLTSYFKDPNRIATNRPTMRVGGWMGMGGKKVDSIDYLTQKIQRFDERIEVTRQGITGAKPENYGFASFETVPYAHLVAKKLEGKKKGDARWDLAPSPQDIIWDNLTMHDNSRRKNKFFGAILLVVFCIFYLIPLAAASLLANLASLIAYVKFIRDWQNNYPTLFAAFVGVVPSLLTALLQLLLPVVIRAIASMQGAITHSRADRVVTARYSAFVIISQFVIFTLLGVVVQVAMKLYVEIDAHSSASEIWNYLKTVPDTLQNTYIIQSSYWLTVFPLRGASALFDLAQLIALLYVWIRTRLFGRTPREIREWTKPPEFDYPVYYSNHLLMVAVALVYAPIAPLVPLFGCFAFAVSYWVYKYQLMYVNTTRVETGGRLWNVCINRVLVCVVLMHALMAVTMGLTSNWYHSISIAPPFIGVFVFKFFLDRQFSDRFRWYVPSQTELAELRIHHADARKNRLERRFGHPSMFDPLFTPMLHKKIQHLLPTIYHGRIDQTRGTLEGKKVEQNKIGGLTFDLLEESQLAFDRNAYLHQRDEDAMTISSATQLQASPGTGPGMGPGAAGRYVDGGDYFNTRREQYLQHGASKNGSPLGTPIDDMDVPNELSRMPTGGTMGPNSSTDQLIQYPPSYAVNSFGSQPGGSMSRYAGHQPTSSVGSTAKYPSVAPSDHEEEYLHEQQQQQRRMSAMDFGVPLPSSPHANYSAVSRSRTPSPGPDQAYRAARDSRASFEGAFGNSLPSRHAGSQQPPMHNIRQGSLPPGPSPRGLPMGAAPPRPIGPATSPPFIPHPPMANSSSPFAAFGPRPTGNGSPRGYEEPFDRR